jgi:hypothetical protein
MSVATPPRRSARLAAKAKTTNIISASDDPARPASAGVGLAGSSEADDPASPASAGAGVETTYRLTKSRTASGYVAMVATKKTGRKIKDEKSNGFVNWIDNLFKHSSSSPSPILSNMDISSGKTYVQLFIEAILEAI